MQSIKDLVTKRTESKSLSERAELIKFFVSHLRNKGGKPFKPAMIAIKLSHLSLKDLYYLKSSFNDLLYCKGLDSASKWFWWALRVKN